MSKGPDRMRSLTDSTRELLGNVEAELQATDRAEEQIGQHADKALGKLNAEIANRRKQLSVAGNDPDAEAEYFYMLAHRRHAAQVRGLAEKHRQQAGGKPRRVDPRMLPPEKR